MGKDRPMKWDRIPTASVPADARLAGPREHRHAHATTASLSRRRFLQGSAAVAAGGAVALGPGLASAAGPGLGDVVPIPTTQEFFPGFFSHIQGPPLLGGPNADPSTVYNFEGISGIAFVSGTVERRNRRTGEVRNLPYLFNDMRFMKGRFRGRDGHVRRGTFAFI